MDELQALGWKPLFERSADGGSPSKAAEYVPARVGAHHGGHVLCLTGADALLLPIALLDACGELAVGDWVLLDAGAQRGVRRLERESLIVRKAAGEKVQTQLVAANLDSLLIVSSCNHDFNPSRLERYLALASEGNVTPIVVLTKSDLCDDSAALRQRAAALASGLVVEAIDARDPRQAACLAGWCGPGQTVALVGSSGVGKSTLATTLGAGPIATQSIREHDSKGRHTTTVRSLYRLAAGGLLIDTPGMRELQLADCEHGVGEVFQDVVEFAAACRFRDCSHEGEPGCAVESAIERGELDRRRLQNYRKLQSEQARNSQTLRQRRHESRKLGKFYKSVQKSKRRRREGEW